MPKIRSIKSPCGSSTATPSPFSMSWRMRLKSRVDLAGAGRADDMRVPGALLCGKGKPKPASLGDREKGLWLSRGVMERERSLRSGAEINPRVSLRGRARVSGIFEAQSARGIEKPAVLREGESPVETRLWKIRTIAALEPTSGAKRFSRLESFCPKTCRNPVHRPSGDAWRDRQSEAGGTRNHHD